MECGAQRIWFKLFNTQIFSGVGGIWSFLEAVATGTFGI
jgi:hypothetical protein